MDFSTNISKSMKDQRRMFEFPNSVWPFGNDVRQIMISRPIGTKNLKKELRDNYIFYTVEDQQSRVFRNFLTIHDESYRQNWPYGRFRPSEEF